LIKNNGLTLRDVITCRDDIMNYLISMGVNENISFKIMEDVRKGKGIKNEYLQTLSDSNIPK
jgi:DNA polymerase-3 subunit alpha (Gram-positive type)